ncbi:uncharacterized protein BO87DRAFT_11297 [Aspergillus neoniger CBS 115656]|uniref:Uncharacterized protein n=1 Tax=Aspergillus neoniger (strain CBS 115656) TaxID=1448310 RepID=A0A318YYD7_ASPNB|nr:hypothetical protein BO87DRAFT_11297 [Aspergillus neoniger CBS 115656]PYH39975.1 hypothetical protein BO87DRAFT_11297 [Aspergillus neoniger CBS 115656]
MEGKLRAVLGRCRHRGNRLAPSKSLVMSHYDQPLRANVSCQEHRAVTDCHLRQLTRNHRLDTATLWLCMTLGETCRLSNPQEYTCYLRLTWAG